MYRVVRGIIDRENEKLDMYVEVINSKVKQHNANYGRTRPDFLGKGYGTTVNNEGVRGYTHHTNVYQERHNDIW